MMVALVIRFLLEVQEPEAPDRLYLQLTVAGLTFRYNLPVRLDHMTEVKWLTEEERAAWLKFAAVLELLPGVLDAQLTVDENLTHFDYYVLAMLSEAPDRTLRMTALAGRTNATLPRLSRVVSRLEGEGYLERTPCREDGRATNATLTPTGWGKVVDAAPGHVATVRAFVIDALTPAQVRQLAVISSRLLRKLDPKGRMFASAE
jgi:DNA-binding MarR family transcriptional regulator